MSLHRSLTFWHLYLKKKKKNFLTSKGLLQKRPTTGGLQCIFTSYAFSEVQTSVTRYSRGRFPPNPPAATFPVQLFPDPESSISARVRVSWTPSPRSPLPLSPMTTTTPSSASLSTLGPLSPPPLLPMAMTTAAMEIHPHGVGLCLGSSKPASLTPAVSPPPSSSPISSRWN